MIDVLGPERCRRRKLHEKIAIDTRALSQVLLCRWLPEKPV